MRFFVAVNVDISIHAPTRGATAIAAYLLEVLKFQSTLPREERLLLHYDLYIYYLFQSTLPREERQSLNNPLITYLLFQSTLPREERLICISQIRLKCYFNPRSHERSDSISVKVFAKLPISIHAPTRGATCILAVFPSPSPNFNPRSHERSD